MGPNGSGNRHSPMCWQAARTMRSRRATSCGTAKASSAWSPTSGRPRACFSPSSIRMEIPGVTTMTFLRAAVNATRKKRGQAEYSIPEFMKLVRTRAAELGVKDEMLKRPLNVGFSGGEKKRMEVLQMSLLEPTLCVLDETDSGLDIDAIRIVVGRRQQDAVAGPRHARHHALPAASDAIFNRTKCTCWRMAASRRPAARNWRSNSRNPDMPSSRARPRKRPVELNGQCTNNGAR